MAALIAGVIVRMAGRPDAPAPGGAAKPPAPGVRIVRTGHAPVLEQIARQVRSSSGMTFGVRTADGPRMPPLGPTRSVP